MTELKVRINTYGYNENNTNEYCFNDSHIWKLIFEMEKEDCYSEKLVKCPEKMIDYISLLLKDDWERSKEEVNDIRKCFQYPVSSISLTIIITALLFFAPKYAVLKNISVQETILLICAIIIILIILASWGVDKWHYRSRKRKYNKSFEKIIENRDKP